VGIKIEPIAMVDWYGMPFRTRMKVAASGHTITKNLGDHVLYGSRGHNVFGGRGSAMSSTDHTARSRLLRETTSPASGDSQGEVVIAHRHELGLLAQVLHFTRNQQSDILRDFLR
jgi:hypothetical protein